MTGWKIDHNFIPKEFDRFIVGFDPLVKKISEAADQAVKLAQNYPPYNIKQIDENKYVIEMAVAGFGKQDIELELEDGKLVVKGNRTYAEEEDTGEYNFPEFLYKGLAMRPFTRQFTLADNVEIKGADMLNGILKIWLEALTPESKKIKIDINDVEKDFSR